MKYPVKTNLLSSFQQSAVAVVQNETLRQVIFRDDELGEMKKWKELALWLLDENETLRLKANQNRENDSKVIAEIKTLNL